MQKSDDNVIQKTLFLRYRVEHVIGWGIMQSGLNVVYYDHSKVIFSVCGLVVAEEILCAWKMFFELGCMLCHSVGSIVKFQYSVVVIHFYTRNGGSFNDS